MTTVAVVGAAGFTGGEVCRLLLGHPRVDRILAVTNEAEVEATHPGLRAPNLHSVPVDEALAPGRSQFAFLCTPQGTAMRLGPGLREAGIPFVDLSPDLRFESADAYAAAYGQPHVSPELLPATYGLPEFNGAQVAESTVVANPGCFTAALLLALVPLLRSGVVASADPLSVFAVNGTTGANIRSSHLAHPRAFGNVLPYDLDGHRHVPEIAQGLRTFAGADGATIDMSTMHGDFARGICAIISASPATAEATARDDAVAVLDMQYRASPFVDVVLGGDTKGPNAKDYRRYAQLAATRGTNRCQLSVDFDRFTNRLKIVSVIDNLGKGAAGNAIQNFNLMMGFAETAGLRLFAS